MEKLSLGLIAWLLISTAAAQDSLYVFQVKGEVILVTGKADRMAKKGSLLTASSSLRLGNGASLTAIDQRGVTYEAVGPATVGFQQLLARKGKPRGSNMTAQYLTYVWKEFVGGERNETLIGAAFRGEMRMLTPTDSAKVVNSKVRFNWKTDSLATAYYVLIRNIETGELAKFETDGSRLALYGDNSVFAGGSYVEWTVTTEAFPNLNNLPFFVFELIDRNTYRQLETEHQAFIDDLRLLGMDERAIADALCETFGICRFH